MWRLQQSVSSTIASVAATVTTVAVASLKQTIYNIEQE